MTRFMKFDGQGLRRGYSLFVLPRGKVDPEAVTKLLLNFTNTAHIGSVLTVSLEGNNKTESRRLHQILGGIFTVSRRQGDGDTGAD